MPTRRHLIAASSLLALGLTPAHAGGSFASFVAGVAAQARSAGIAERVINEALRGISPNAKVLELDRAQPEFTQTWQHYRDTRLSQQRIALGRAAYRQDRSLIAAVATQMGVGPAVIMGIWGMETNYGGFMGGFNVVEALATLAWDGRRASYFRTELMAALGILNDGDITAPRMLGSYAGAMGQPQFMPSSFARYAVDFDGDGRRDIWDDRSDVLASIANYLAKSGWVAGQPWGVEVTVPGGMGAADTGKSGRMAVASWARRGVRPIGGGSLPRPDLAAYLVMPGDKGGDKEGDDGAAFLAYPNFAAIRRYNPSDFYALAVGMLGDLVVG